MNNNPSVDDYISGFPGSTRELLNQIRDTIKNAAPEAEELISYRMPAFRFHGMLVWFAGYKNHIGFYPASTGIKAFDTELSGYKRAKGSVQFPLDKPLPLELIAKIVRFRVSENLEKSKVTG
jgi:uncharacterized protein YdhG (YjbR/CyaY superfamily)